MVASSKELVNTLNLSTLHSQYNNQNPHSTNTYQELSLMNIEDNIPSKHLVIVDKELCLYILMHLP